MDQIDALTAGGDGDGGVVVDDYVDDENDGVDEDPVFAREDNVSFVDTDEESVATVVSGESGDEED